MFQFRIPISFFFWMKLNVKSDRTAGGQRLGRVRRYRWDGGRAGF